MLSSILALAGTGGDWAIVLRVAYSKDDDGPQTVGSLDIFQDKNRKNDLEHQKRDFGSCD